MVKDTLTIRRQQPNCLRVFDHFMGLVLKELIWRCGLANQWTGFYMIGTSVMKEVKGRLFVEHISCRCVLTSFGLLLNLRFLGRKLERATLFASVLTDLASCIISFTVSFGSLSLVTCTHMNYNFHWWFFLCRFFVMVPICNFCPRNKFDNNVFLMFHRFGDNITVYILYDGISENCSCMSFRFWRCRSSGNDLGLDTIAILRMICRATDQILPFIILFFFFIFFFLF